METPKTRWFYQPLTVIAGLFLLGPFAFPLLWKSPSFSRPWKIFWTLAISIMTVYMIWGTWKIVEIILKEFGQFAA